MDDGQVIELHAPLPGLARQATIRFFGPEQGMLGRSQPSTRAGADHAVLRIEFDDSRVEERRLDDAGVEAYLSEVSDFKARVAEKRVVNEANRRTLEELDAERAERSARIRPTCGYCGVPREHRGRRHQLTIHDPAVLAHPLRAWSPGVNEVDVYACPECGSLELFEPSGIDHPLGG